MFIDARTLPENFAIRAEVCVIGGGVAGIVIALELARRGVHVALLESGGFRPDEATKDLHRGENIGIPYTFADGHRCRYLGGSSNCWGGWCRPFDPEDWERRDWVPDSGWPISGSDMRPHYERAHEWLGLGPTNYDPPFWEAMINRPDVWRLRHASGEVGDIISQFSPPARMGRRYRHELERSIFVTVYLWANADELRRLGSESVREVAVKTIGNRAGRVIANEFVLAAGGIENARLLLASNREQAAGLGNGHDLVGRYFMDHPRLVLGKLRPTPAWRKNKLYDIRFHYHSRAVSAGGVDVAAQLRLSPQVQARERILNAYGWLVSVFPYEESPHAALLQRLQRGLRRHSVLSGTFARKAVGSLLHLHEPFWRMAMRRYHIHELTEYLRVQIIIEPAPNPQSRVTLARERDALGMPRVQVDWRIGELEKRTYDTNMAYLTRELERNGLQLIEAHEPLVGRDWPASLVGTWHHMGTTRMHASPRRGVVDAHCQVHGLDNLHVAGSSVFPTAGANFPTINLTALAVRLALRIAPRSRPRAEIKAVENQPLEAVP